MTFEYIVEKENNQKSVSKNMEAEIVKSVVDDYKKYNDARSTNLSKSNAVIDEVFFKHTY